MRWNYSPPQQVSQRGIHRGDTNVHRISAMGVFALAGLLSDADAGAALYFPAAFPATYDVLVCQQSTCSFEHPEQADYVGTLMLFPATLTSAQLTLPNNRQYARAMHSDAGANACFEFTHQSQSNPYLGSKGLTMWSGDGSTIYLNLGNGVDAGYSATLAQAGGDGLAGTSAHWGAGVAASDDMHRQTVVARRRGSPDLSVCPTVSTQPDLLETRAMQIHHRLVEIEERYDSTLISHLRASPSPRDWAMSTLFERTSNKASAEQTAVMERALLATQDPLVYWIALHSAHKRWSNEPIPDDTSVRELPRLEPDNIAAWVEPLAADVKRKDEAAIANQLAKIAAATHYDEHAAAILGAMLDAYQRVPVPKEYLTVGTELIQHLNAQTAPYYLTQRRGLMGGGTRLDTGLPGLDVLLGLCRAALKPHFDAVRTMLCTHVARTIAQHATTFWESQNGIYLLKGLNTYNAEDLALARRQRWILENLTSLPTPYDKPPNATAAQNYVDDLIRLNNESTAMRNALVRAGKSANPPQDWPDRVYPFQGERLSETRRRVWGPLAMWIARLTAPPDVGIIDAYY